MKRIPQNKKENKKKHTLPEAAKPYMFKPGQSGNPGGRPKGRSISAAMKALLNEVDPKTKKQLAEKLAQSIIKGAHKNPSFANIVLDRTEGKVIQDIRVGDLDNLPEEIAEARKRAAVKEK